MQPRVNNSGTGSTSDVSSNSVNENSVNEDLQADDKQEQVPVAASVKKNPLDAYSFSESDSLLRPVNGDVVLKYSMDSTIYFESLQVQSGNFYCGKCGGQRCCCSRWNCPVSS